MEQPIQMWELELEGLQQEQEEDCYCDLGGEG